MLDRDGYPPGVPCWIDTAQPKPDAAVAFYGGLFGWEFEDRMPSDVPGNYFVGSTATRTMPQLMTELHSFAARTPGRHEARLATSRAPQNAQQGHPGNRGPVAPSWVSSNTSYTGDLGATSRRPGLGGVRSDSTAPDRAGVRRHRTFSVGIR